MRQHKFTAIACFGVLVVCCTARTAPQDQQQNQLDTSAEYNAYQAAHNENDAQTKIKLLDNFATKYPDSGLRLQIYRDYYLTYFSMRNYPPVIDYADKLVALGDKVDVDSRILALVSREVAYSASCSDPALRTPEAYAKARDAGRQGLQMFGQWQKPENLTDEQFAAEKKSFEIILHDVAGMAESGLAGSAVNCMVPTPNPNSTSSPARTPYDRSNFDRMINDIKEQERQSPRVR
jgi:hypothetical protein